MDLKLKLRFQNATTWTQLEKLGSNRLAQSSYVWLFIVPTVAKALEAVEKPFEIIKGLKISLDLPFSWYLFYAAAVFIALGQTI